ncbi:glycosyltransferase family 2 protein [Mesonia phycicola]|nr:glycosyltransferase family 2 protein [Mesonia phycicola]
MNKILTIFTPTYNRASLLKRVFTSLQKQTYKNFEWIIVDDGSTDNTEEVVKSFIEYTQDFSINYFKQKNGGKHRAINFGVKKAKGDFFLILDSDDYLKEEAIEVLNPLLDQSRLNANLAGVAVRRAYSDGNIVGNIFDKSILANSVSIRYQHKIIGDLVEIFKTEILKKYKFPEIENEKFCPEALVWNRIAQYYNLQFYNLGLYITEYLPGGLTQKIIKIRMQSPIASMLHYVELVSYKIPIKEKVKATINFWRFSFNDSSSSILDNLKKLPNLFYGAFLPLGLLMYFNDKRSQ